MRSAQFATGMADVVPPGIHLSKYTLDIVSALGLDHRTLMQPDSEMLGLPAEAGSRCAAHSGLDDAQRALHCTTRLLFNGYEFSRGTEGRIAWKPRQVELSITVMRYGKQPTIYTDHSKRTVRLPATTP